MSQKEKRPIVIRKIVKKGHGHHGGAWKVAYADFVTAMMAFFMVMWILGMGDDVKSAIESYFQNPVGFSQGASGSGVVPLSGGVAPAPAANRPLHVVARQLEEESYREIGERIRTRIVSSDGTQEIAAQVEIVMTEQGLRIELVEGDDGQTFFPSGSAVLKPAAARALQIIAAELGKAAAPVVVEGHTDAAPFGASTGYTNWELSSDRANAARRAMLAAGLREQKVREVRGHADRSLRRPENPLDPSNRRISVLLPFSTATDVAGPGGIPGA